MRLVARLMWTPDRGAARMFAKRPFAQSRRRAAGIFGARCTSVRRRVFGPPARGIAGGPRRHGEFGEPLRPRLRAHRPLLGIASEAFGDRLGKRRWHVGPELDARVIRRLAGDEPVRDAAERVEIGARTRNAAAQRFGGDEAGTAFNPPLA